ncbi:response regulator transcription factor [Nocardia harenae]|uniref:response regulator transcription factor n=1 Tax=Nocardia harenae TaxID=358707 RepID=UPI000834DE3C|nr:response regulator transcription factor [Nocardia harenae]
MGLLLATGDPRFRDTARAALERAGHDVLAGVAGTALRDDTALAILDAGPGIARCRAIRAGPHPELPIILLTTSGHERIRGLEAGADDCIDPAAGPYELTLRVTAVLRRTHPAVLRDGRIALCPQARSVAVDTVPVQLTPREFDLLEFLLRHPESVFSREQLLAQVWGWDFGDLSTVTVHVKRLRAKLGDQHRLDTVWGRGYAWGAAPSREMRSA